MSESYFFALSPRFLKVQHSFAKNIKPNTKYRLAVFKGIQKSDEMKEGIKSKLVGGRIQLQAPSLLFNLPYYNPSKNIQFAVKLYEQKPNEEQTEIASYWFGCSQFIKTYKADKTTCFQVTGELQADLSLEFELFVQKSKQLLNQILQKTSSNAPRSSNELPEEIKSQSGQSKQFVREGEGFLSPRKRIERKRGNEGRLRSRSKSQQKGDTLQSPINIKSNSSLPKSQASVKNTEKSIVSDQKVYQYQPVNKMKYTDTKEIFDIQVDRGNSPVRSPRNGQQKSPKPQSRANFTSREQPKISNPSLNPITQQPMAQPKTSTLPTSLKSPSSVTKIQASQVKHTSKVFDIEPLNSENSPKGQHPKSPGKYQPARSPRIATFESSSQPEVKVSNAYKIPQNPLQKPLNDTKSRLGTSLNTSSFEHNMMKESKIVITLDGEVDQAQPQAIIVGSEADDTHSIQVKAKPLTKVKGTVRQSSTLKGSLRLSEAIHSKQHEEEAKLAAKSFEERKNQILYGVFLVVSVFLIYNAMMPTRRV